MNPRRWQILFITLMVGAVTANAADRAASARRSEHFVVNDVRGPRPSVAVLGANTNSAWAKLDPDVLTVSADRIQEAFAREMGIAEGPRFTLQLNLQSATEQTRDITVVSTFYLDGWRYRLWVPDRIERMKLVRGLVQTLLLEFANRAAGAKSSEIPLWLSEGLTHHLDSTVGAELIVDSVPAGSMRRIVRNLHGGDPTRETRQFLAERQALTFAELADPAPGAIADFEYLKLYQASAHLFLFELARLPEGRSKLLQMLRALPHCWNWQTAFLHAYRSHFERLLDVEKWWSVRLATCMKNDPGLTWSVDECLEKLDQFLLPTVELRAQADVLPVQTRVTLQQLISESEFGAHKPVLQQVIGQLALLRLTAPAEMIPIIDGYQICLRQYIDKRTAISFGSGKLPMGIHPRAAIHEVIRRLDELLVERESIRRKSIEQADRPATPASRPS